MKTTVSSLPRASKSLALAASLLALSLPSLALAQGNSPNTPAAEHSQGRGGQGLQNSDDGGSAPVPEPATWLAMGTLSAMAIGFARRKRKQARPSGTV